MTLTNEVLNDPSVRNFTKEIIKKGLDRDIVDSIRDVELALKCLKEMYEEIQIRQYSWHGKTIRSRKNNLIS